MKTYNPGKKIKELRNRKGLSQEELAEQAQLSLRTVQRIENDETDARGDTLKRLAAALNITPEDLTEINAEPTEILSNDNRNFLLQFNLSALSFIIFPLLGIALPLALWLSNRKTLNDIDKPCKRLINFQISWCLFIAVTTIILINNDFFHIPSILNLGAGELLLLGFPLFYAINFIYIVFNSVLVYNTRQIFYQPAVPFLR
ncbi:transcriptional regulator with XRE-family HTH domain [Mucilaginibacter sp. SG538B]|uniref:helix-turn-helix domain-containing protein n=1 Tax=Mucilaginibacter TaxID=423349 RepID=UPI00159EB75A|nr:helix-turn-helix domain-containing protein [Mucilaginibacter sp. SG538B]NVM66410.1 transcriptional regulator with XRE-family HTH domain [Mucilaginibacter sp. SG538B]